MVDSTRLLMIGVRSGQRSFEMAKTRALALGRDYICRLEVQGPAGPLHKEDRQCLAMADLQDGWRYLPPSWADQKAQAGSVADRGQKPSPEHASQQAADAMKEAKTPRPKQELSPAQIQSKSPEPLIPLVPGNQAPEDLAKSSSLSPAGSSLEGNRSQPGYVASKSSRKYHLASCRYAAKIRPDLIITFPDAQTAEARDYLPCKVCQP